MTSRGLWYMSPAKDTIQQNVLFYDYKGKKTFQTGVWGPTSESQKQCKLIY